MVPNRGYQHIISPGVFFKLGPLSIQFKPEHHYGENKIFDGFWEGHYPIIWSKRYRLWNRIDMPERFGTEIFNRTTLGQSSIRLNWKNISFGISNENLWWGPSIRNSIMLSNHAEGFKHITFNTTKPISTFIGNFEWQIISAKLESSGYLPSNSNIQHLGTDLYVPKINQLGQTNDWRYLQGYTVTYSPKWISGLSLGFIRWVQAYSALYKGKYTWMEGNPTWFPAFSNLFRNKDKYENYEAQTNQAAGIFLRWFWKNSKAEIYLDFSHNDSKSNFRDLLLDSDHSRAITLGLQKVLKINNDDFLFTWEWTDMAQTASRLLRNAGSWYEHAWTKDGYTNQGEVLGAGIGPGSNSNYFALNRVSNKEKLGIAFEIIEHDKDFFYEINYSGEDRRQNWKDYNFIINFSKKYKNLWMSSNMIYSRNLNYQWGLDETTTENYYPGNNVNNFHMNLKLTYLIPFIN